MFYLWRLRSVLKHCKVPKYYDQDCRLGIVYGLCKVHKDIVDHCPLLSTLSVINTVTHKFLVSILKSLTSNEYAMKDSYAFARETMEEDPEFPMASLDKTLHKICKNTGFH